jgi:hypothetical protein
MAYLDEKWCKAQQRVASWLRGKGLTIKHVGEFGDFNLCTPKMTRIRVRWAPYKQIEYAQPQKGWKILLTNNGTVNERNVDFYVLVLNYDEELKALGIAKPMLLVLPSPMKQIVMTITTRHLLSGKWSTNFDNWKAIKEFDEQKQ